MYTIFATALGLILTALVALQQIAFWQRKEYRPDRVWADLTQNRRSWLAVALAIGSLVFLFPLQLAPLAEWISVAGVVIVLLYVLRQVSQRGVIRPHATTKTILIGVITAGIVAVTVMLLNRTFLTGARLGWGIMVLSPVAVAVAVAVGNALTNVQKHRIVRQAQIHRGHLSTLTVIGITGSYGKTSTKYFVHHLLGGEAHGVLMSQARRNEAFVVAQDMLARVQKTTRMYVVEMAAYKAGEIKKLTELTRPHIGVVTAIRNQHVALFGSLEKLAEAKWELPASLPSDGVAVLNTDDVTIQTKAKSYTGRIIWYSTKEKADVYVTDIDMAAETFTGTYHVGSFSERLIIPLAGEGYVGATVAAAAAAHAAGVSSADIFERLKSLSPIPQTMVVKRGVHGATIVDDSYSANEDGVLMAIRHLQRFPHPRKIVVLRPLIELGTETGRVHEAIGRAVAAANVELFLYDVAGAEDIEKAARGARSEQRIQRIAAPKTLAEAVVATLKNDAVCLLENRLPENIRHAVLA